jgi:hypothetical protein
MNEFRQFVEFSLMDVCSSLNRFNSLMRGNWMKAGRAMLRFVEQSGQVTLEMGQFDAQLLTLGRQKIQTSIQ